VFITYSCGIDSSKEVSPVGNKPPVVTVGIVQYTNGNLYAAGWAADPEEGAPVKKVELYIDGKRIGEATTGIERKDVAEHFKDFKWLKSGWAIKTKILLSKGYHIVHAVGLDKYNTSGKSKDKDLVVE